MTMIIRTYLIIIEGKQGKGFSAFAPDVLGCTAAGETEKETIELMKEALELHLEGTPENEIPFAASHFEDIPPNDYEPGSRGEYITVKISPA